LEVTRSAGAGLPWWSLLLLTLAVPHPGAAQAILNVEGLHSWEVDGFHAEINTRLNASSGNTDLFQVGGTLAGGFRAHRHWTRLLLGIERLKKDDAKLLDNRYVHLRYNYFFGETFRSFHFYQIQTNQNLLLTGRWLVGSGLRFRALGGDGRNLEIGSGVMYEAETLQRSALEPGEDRDTRTLRLANLLVASWDLARENRLVAVAYYQPDVRRLEDYRFLGEAGLSLGITQGLSLDVALDWRHDSRAPRTLEEDDFSLKTGLTLRLR
jgi:hypothetical protein